MHIIHLICKIVLLAERKQSEQNRIIHPLKSNLSLLRKKLKYEIEENGAPGGIRTPDQVVRSHLLYPAELRVRMCEANDTEQ